MALLGALRSVTSFRLGGVPEAESLMNFSKLGSLQCHCEPTNAAGPRNDRRRSCRACGNAILATEPTRLYETLSKADIRRVTRNLKRASIDARNADLVAGLTSLSGLHGVNSLAELGAHTV